MSTHYEAPHVNGIMELSNTEIERLRSQLVNIQEAFVPSYEKPVCDTFYLVVEHTKKHSGQATFIQLNGDTAEYVLYGAGDNSGTQSE